jgi:hypothetical protein
MRYMFLSIKTHTYQQLREFYLLVIGFHYVAPRGRWCDIVLNIQAPTEDKIVMCIATCTKN